MGKKNKPAGESSARPFVNSSAATTVTTGDTSTSTTFGALSKRDVEIEDYVLGILERLGLDATSEHFRETPRRFREYLQEYRRGTEEDLVDLLKAGFEETKENNLVVQGPIQFHGACAHHLLPFTGTAVLGYIPAGRIVGLSKLTRVVRAAGIISPTTQEHITNLIADTFHSTLRPMATGIVTKATHGCMAGRGVHAPDTHTAVSAVRGVFLTNPAAKSEFMSFVTMML